MESKDRAKCRDTQQAGHHQPIAPTQAVCLLVASSAFDTQDFHESTQHLALSHHSVLVHVLREWIASHLGIRQVSRLLGQQHATHHESNSDEQERQSAYEKPKADRDPRVGQVSLEKVSAKRRRDGNDDSKESGKPDASADERLIPGLFSSEQLADVFHQRFDIARRLGCCKASVRQGRKRLGSSRASYESEKPPHPASEPRTWARNLRHTSRCGRSCTCCVRPGCRAGPEYARSRNRISRHGR